MVETTKLVTNATLSIEDFEHTAFKLKAIGLSFQVSIVFPTGHANNALVKET